MCAPLEKEQACTNLRKMCMCASKKKNRPVLIWGRCVYASLEKEQACSILGYPYPVPVCKCKYEHHYIADNGQRNTCCHKCFYVERVCTVSHHTLW